MNRWKASPFRFSFAIAAVGAALLFGLLETAQLAVRSAAEQNPVAWSDALRLTLPRWLLLAPLALAVRRLCARFPLDGPRRGRRILVHLAASLLFAAAHLAACVIVYGFLIEGMPNRFPLRFGRLFTVYLASDLLIYWGIVGAWSAVHFFRVSRARELAATQLAADLSRARLEALRAQLNPHFLFNTLNTISVLARSGDRDAVVRMLASLSDLLRVALDRDLPHEIPLEREIAFLEGYLEIQSTRFSDRLTVRREIDPDTLGALVPSLVLQPLVENAVQHGVASRPGPGSVRIAARRSGERLRLEVHDSGRGFAAAHDEARAEARAGRNGIGLDNTRARLAQFYGDAHAFESGNSPEGGAFVAISIPFRCEPGGTPRDRDLRAGSDR